MSDRGGRDGDVSLRDELIPELREAGLTSYEAMSYVSLISRWPASAADLCKETGIPDTKIYHVLESLQAKGVIGIRKGRPSLFRPLPPREALGNLRNALREDYDDKSRKLDLLALKMEPLFEKTTGQEEVELAYIIKGTPSILNRMKALIESAKHEVTLFIPDENIFEKLSDTIRTVKKRGVEVHLAVAQSLANNVSSNDSPKHKILTEDCEKCWAIVKDNEVLLNVSGWQGPNASGILTHDPSLIAMCKSWLTNPSCCN